VRRSLALVPLLIGLAVLVTAVPAAARKPMVIGIANPDSAGLSALDTHIAQNAGIPPRLWALWSDWGGRGGSQICQPGQGNCAFPYDSVVQLQQRGITPVIWWQPTNPNNPLQGLYERFKRTTNGYHDAYIIEWARAARAAGEATGKPVMIRYAHEATGYWFPWSIGRFDNTKELYKQAWRHVWKIFKREGALPWVRFIWSTVFPYKWAYPGDKYVSFVGVTVLNFGADRRWRMPAPLIDKRVRASKKITKKPIIISELATNYLGGNKSKWLKQAYKRSYEKHPKIRAIMYLDTDQPAILAAQPDWRLVKPDDGSAMVTYNFIASRKRFQGQLW